MSLVSSYKSGPHLIQKFIVLMVVCSLQLLVPPSNCYLDVNQYCKAWDVNFRPIICILRNGTQTAPPNYNPSPTQYPILPVPVDYEDEEEDCCCEMTCIPRIVHQRSIQSHDDNTFSSKSRPKRTLSTNYRCRSCGMECPVSTSRQPTCSCVVPTAKSECSCTATCASFRYEPFYFQRNRNKDDTDDANCILTVTALEDWRLGEERPPYICECRRSKEAENSSRPDFICICQRVSRD